MGLFVCTAAGAVWAFWNGHRLKKEVHVFADQVEAALDRMIYGKELDGEDEEKDTLWGKVGAKFQRVNHVWQRKQEETIREKEQMKGLISDISHQTKTPIANISVYLEFLQEEELSEKGREFLDHVEGQVEKLDFLLQSMVKMSRLETGIICIQSKRANLYETLGRAVAALVPAASAKQLRLFVDCDVTVSILHDPRWTQEAIFNVLDNAVKYTDQGGSIHIAVTRQEIFTKISIQDSGKGIARERQAEIFTRFYREPEVHDKEGIGIGLYLGRKIMELQDGYIEVHSGVGEGSEFCMYLPNN